MALFDDIFPAGNWVTGLAIGVGAVVVLPFVTPIFQPVAKTAIKGNILAYQGAAELFEDISDLVVEAVAEAGGGGHHAGARRGGAGHTDHQATPHWDKSGGRRLTEEIRVAGPGIWSAKLLAQTFLAQD